MIDVSDPEILKLKVDGFIGVHRHPNSPLLCRDQGLITGATDKQKGDQNDHILYSWKMSIISI